LAAAAGASTELPVVDSIQVAPLEGRVVTTCEWHHEGRLVARYVRVDTLGHAWSGGDAAYPYNDPAPPDATALLGNFVREVAA